MDDILTRIQKRIDLHGMGQDVHVFRAAAAEIERLRALILNIQSLAEKGFPIDAAKLATRCRESLANASSD